MVPERLAFEFDAQLWQWEGKAAWHFVSLPPDAADEIEARFAGRSAGFGSVPVEVAVGGTRWTTSIFPDRKGSTYLLPMKKAVREKEDLTAGSDVHVVITVRLDRQ